MMCEVGEAGRWRLLAALGAASERALSRRWRARAHTHPRPRRQGGERPAGPPCAAAAQVRAALARWVPRCACGPRDARSRVSTADGVSLLLAFVRSFAWAKSADGAGTSWCGQARIESEPIVVKSPWIARRTRRDQEPRAMAASLARASASSRTTRRFVAPPKQQAAGPPPRARHHNHTPQLHTPPRPHRTLARTTTTSDVRDETTTNVPHQLSLPRPSFSRTRTRARSDKEEAHPAQKLLALGAPLPHAAGNAARTTWRAPGTR